jgi:hypothetical protein
MSQNLINSYTTFLDNKLYPACKSTGPTGQQGPTGPAGLLDVTGTPSNYGDYLFWNGNQWGVGDNKVSIGTLAGNIAQETNTVAIGTYSGQFQQGTGSIAIGSLAGNISQKTSAVALGNYAGATNQGNYSVAIGYSAGSSAQNDNTIVLNASGNPLNTSTGSALYISPVRNDTTTSGLGILQYNTSTSEISYSKSRNVQTGTYANAVENSSGAFYVGNATMGYLSIKPVSLLFGVPIRVNSTACNASSVVHIENTYDSTLSAITSFYLTGVSDGYFSIVSPGVGTFITPGILGFQILNAS